LWHKIFGSTAEQTAKLSEPALSEPSSSDVNRADESMMVNESMEVVSEEDRAGGEFADMSDRGDRTDFADDEAAPEERKRGRRRRRRGGRGRRPAERPGERPSAPLHEESEGIDDLGVELEDEDDEAGDGATFEDGAEQTDEGFDADRSNSGFSEAAGRGKSAVQRAIPSWDEAIGFIVDSNMQSRSQRRPPSRSGNGYRGRPRGRRKN
jgi:ribonuclease E